MITSCYLHLIDFALSYYVKANMSVHLSSLVKSDMNN